MKQPNQLQGFKVDKSTIINLEKGKIPPQALDLEEVVLGAMMIDKKGVDEVIDILNPDAFYKEAHQYIFEAIFKLFENSEPIDLLTVKNDLQKEGELEMVGGAYYLTQLTNRISSAANIEYHSRIISQKHIQRELIRISSETIRDAYDETTDVFTLLDNAEKNLFQVAEGNIKKNYADMATLIKEAKDQIKKATRVGLLLALVFRILLLLGVTWLISMKAPFFSFDLNWFKGGITGQSVILILGGIFLLYKSTKEIHHKVEGSSNEESESNSVKRKVAATFGMVIFQIVMIDIVFSFDSVLTAVGMTNGIPGALIIMITAVIISIIIMMIFANPVSNFVNKHPTIQMLALSFLILIGFMLITEGAHLSHIEIFNKPVGAIPKGYLYFAIAFSLGVEALNMKVRKK